MENPPLWVCVIIVGAIIASKFIYRWQSTKYFAKEAEEKAEEIILMMIQQKCSGIIISMAIIYSSSQVGPRRFYKDNFAIRNKKKE